MAKRSTKMPTIASARKIVCNYFGTEGGMPNDIAAYDNLPNGIKALALGVAVIYNAQFRKGMSIEPLGKKKIGRMPVKGKAKERVSAK